MRALALRIRNFRSFKKAQTFTFPQTPGLYFMRGINEVEPRLEANGTGKSSIWDALTWCLFEKTTRGLKAGDVANWDIGKDVEVALDFIDDDQPLCVWTIARTWKPNTWKLSHVAEFVTDEEVIDLAKDPANPVLATLRLEFEPFLQCILTAQGRPMFLDLKSEPQAKLFSDVLGIDRWMDYASRASRKASDQDTISRSLEQRLSNLRGQLSAITHTDLQPKRTEWDDDHARMLADLDVEHADAMADRIKLKERLKDAEKREDDARAAFKSARVDDRLTDRVKRRRRNLSDSRELVAKLKGQAEEKLVHLHAMLDAEGDCPTCGQPWQVKSLKEHVEQLEAESKRFATQVNEEMDTAASLERELVEAEDDLEDADKKEREARTALDDATRNTSNARRSLEACDKQLDTIEDRAEHLETETNPYDYMERDAARRLSTLRDDIEDAQEKLDASHSRYGLLSFWVRGFKELRLEEIAEALTELEVEVNSCVTALGLMDWELRFAVDKETKGGNISRGFNVTVRSPQNPFATPWEAWSGGEAQRLRIAGNMGMADLTRSRTGTTLNLEVWDEPTAGLSAQGITDLLECLSTRARDEERIIFVVDHKAHDFGGFAGHYTIVKAPSGSRIREGDGIS